MKRNNRAPRAKRNTSTAASKTTKRQSARREDSTVIVPQADGSFKLRRWARDYIGHVAKICDVTPEAAFRVIVGLHIHCKAVENARKARAYSMPVPLALRRAEKEEARFQKIAATSRQDEGAEFCLMKWAKAYVADAQKSRQTLRRAARALRAEAEATKRANVNRRGYWPAHAVTEKAEYREHLALAVALDRLSLAGKK